MIRLEESWTMQTMGVVRFQKKAGRLRNGSRASAAMLHFCPCSPTLTKSANLFQKRALQRRVREKSLAAIRVMPA